jgi:hypothetical protein
MMAKSSCSARAMTPSLSLPRFAGEGTLTIGVSEIPTKRGICSLSRAAGEGWGGGLS